MPRFALSYSHRSWPRWSTKAWNQGKHNDPRELCCAHCGIYMPIHHNSLDIATRSTLIQVETNVDGIGNIGNRANESWVLSFLRYASYFYHPLRTLFMHKAVLRWKDSNPNGENEVHNVIVVASTWQLKHATHKCNDGEAAYRTRAINRRSQLVSAPLTFQAEKHIHMFFMQ